MQLNLKQFASISLVSLATCLSTCAVAISWHQESKMDYVRDLRDLKPSISLPALEKVVRVNLPFKVMKKRLKLSDTKKSVEPLNLILTPSNRVFKSMSTKLARPGKSSRLLKLFNKKEKNSEKYTRNPSKKIFNFDKSDFKTISPKAFAKYFGKDHHEVKIPPRMNATTKNSLNMLVEQIRPFFAKWERRALLKKVQKNDEIKLEKYLLPKFARKMVRKYTMYRGPNCFHSALAFNSSDIPRSALLNIKKEKNYHRAMINYDELWRVLQTQFYEVNAKKYPLKYGDVLIFFDTPKGEKGPYFRWIKHAAAYLFGPYTFSKGSKSSNSPYVVRTLTEEWQTWNKFSDHLGVKVYRSIQNPNKSKPPQDVFDWIY